MMTGDMAQFTMGSDVQCTDGACGKLRRVVVDPVARALTHLVVEPGHRDRGGHLVPIALVSLVGPQIGLSCSLAEFEKLEDAEETQLLPGARGTWDYRRQDMLSWPYYGLGAGTLGVGIGGIQTGGMGAGTGIGMGRDTQPRTDTHDRVPAGEVEIRRGQHVHATDGAIGRVQGLVIDPADHRVTHLLLDEGHLWGHKQVAIPIDAVTAVDDGVRLDLAKDQVRDLPAVELDNQD
jgi:sporulation protein YlmC with PRC-barrel domain